MHYFRGSRYQSLRTLELEKTVSAKMDDVIPAYACLVLPPSSIPIRNYLSTTE
jgi:hypothetical protein